MYIVVFPQYILIYSLISNITKNKIVYYIVAAILSFSLGTLIEIPYIFTMGLTGKYLLTYILMGFQVSIGNMACTIIAAIFLYEPLTKLIRKTLSANLIKRSK